MHDATSGRTTGEELEIETSTAQELRCLDAGAWKGSAWSGTVIPTLDEVLAAIPHGTWFFIELKSGVEIIAPLKRALQASGISPGRIRLLSFSAPLIAELSKNLPEWHACWLCDYRHSLLNNSWRPSKADVIDTLARTGACGLAARLTRARRQLAEQTGQAEQTEQAGAEAPRVASGAHDLTFLKRLLFVEVKRSRRYGFPVSLALVSVDGWEALSEKLGPRARASLLGDLAVASAMAVRDIDVSVPLSDDRLVVLMPHTATAGGLQVARRICARVRERKGDTAVTVSVGLASHDGHGTVSFGALVKRASEAMARAREAGGDRAESAEPPKRRSRISIG